MSEKFIAAGVTILLGVVGVAVIATLVSKSANTSGVISAGSSGVSSLLCTALSPLGVCSRSLIPSVDSSITFPPAGDVTLPGGRLR